jgi:hypothetical protein
VRRGQASDYWTLLNVPISTFALEANDLSSAPHRLPSSCVTVDALLVDFPEYPRVVGGYGETILSFREEPEQICRETCPQGEHDYFEHTSHHA